MIRLTRRRTSAHVPKSFQPPKLKAAAAKLADIYYAGTLSGKWEFSGSAWKPAKGRLKDDASGKCAYCEASTAVVAHGDVEHFRPKSTYWWLAFAFDNYLFSCQICNQSFKGDHFPISGPLMVAPTMPAALPTGQDLEDLLNMLVLDATAIDDDHLRTTWDTERADLPNPYLEDPEQLFRYESDDGNEEIWLRSVGTERADRALSAVEAVLGLNREELRRQRYNAYRTFAFFRALTLTALDPMMQQQVMNELRIQQGRSQPFAGMKRFFARNWGLPGPY